MSKRYIDLQKAVELVLGNIAERGPDYKYTEDPWVVEYRSNSGTGGCFNLMFDGYDRQIPSSDINYRKGCLVGSAFVDFGISIGEFVEKDVVHGGVSVTADSLGITMSAAAERYLSMVQIEQDSGRAWGVAHALGLSAALRKLLSPSEELWLESRDVKEINAS